MDGACVYAPRQFVVAHASASLRNTSRHHDKGPVAFHRGDAADEWQAILQVAVEDLRNANVLSVRCFYSWPWVSLNTAHQQPYKPTEGQAPLTVSLCATGRPVATASSG
jgi:hypothetical protein